ncbi:MAG: competence protein CoiA family protein [Promethearchaeota archaeon]
MFNSLSQLKNKKKIVIEIQDSPLSSRELLQRTADYTAQGIHVLWIFNGTTFSRYPFLQH